jgi:hypothetical protein
MSRKSERIGNEERRDTMKIMRHNFFGVEETIKHFGFSPTPQQLTIPFSEAVLEQLKNSHILIAVFPLSILDIRARVERELFCNHEGAWYDNQLFAEEHNEIGWQLIQKTPTDNSISKNWQEQLRLITKDDEVPTAQAMAYTIIGHYLATGERLFEDIYVRTSSMPLDGYHIIVGYFDTKGPGLRVNLWPDNAREHDIGLAVSRKF